MSILDQTKFSVFHSAFFNNLRKYISDEFLTSELLLKAELFSRKKYDEIKDEPEVDFIESAVAYAILFAEDNSF